MTSRGYHGNDGEELPVFPRFEGEDPHIKKEETDEFLSYTNEYVDDMTLKSTGLYLTSSGISIKTEEEDYGFDSDGDVILDSLIKEEVDTAIKQAVGDDNGIESEVKTIVPLFKKIPLSNTELKEGSKEGLDMRFLDSGVKRNKLDSKNLLTPLRTSKRLQSGKGILSLQKSIHKKKLRKVEENLQLEDIFSLLADDLFHVNIDHGKDLPAVSALHERLGEAVNMKWPLFQQTTKELCAFASKANTNRHVKMQTLHMYLTTKLIKNCLLSGCYGDLSLAILPLTSFPKKSPELLWKVGTELLKRTDRPDCSMFLNMMKKLLYHVQQTNVFICQGITSICDSLTNLRSIYNDMSEVISSESFSEDPYVRVFYGQLEYMLWKEEKEKWALNKNAQVDRKNFVFGWGVKEEDEEEEDIGVKDSETIEEPMEMSYHGKRALIYLHCVTQRNGVWDLILPKYLEVASHYQEESEVWRALKLHAENNRFNPISFYLQLQWMTRKGGFEIDEMLDVYKQLAQIDPTNNLIKSLCIILNKENHSKELFELLMRRLSKVECFNSSFDWNLLFGLLRADDEVRSMFDNYLRLNETWRKTHFSVSRSSNNLTLNSEVRATKAEIAEIMNLYEDVKPIKPLIHSLSTHNLNSHRVKLSTINSIDEYDEDLREKQYEWMFSYDDVSSPKMLSVEDLSSDDSLTGDSSTEVDNSSSEEDEDSSVDEGNSSTADDSSTNGNSSANDSNFSKMTHESRLNVKEMRDNVDVSINRAASPILFYNERKEPDLHESGDETDENVDIQANNRKRGVKRKLSTCSSSDETSGQESDNNEQKRKEKSSINIRKRKKKKRHVDKDDVIDENWNPLTKSRDSYKSILRRFLES